jgi:urea transport system substrate-binding protein
LVGHLAAWNYFMSVENDANKDFIAKWKTFTKNDKRVTNDPMEAHVIGFNMWIKAVEKAGTTETDKVADAMIGLEVPNLTGGTAKMLPNHHLTKPVLIGEIQENGQFEVVSKTPEVAGDAWSDFLPDSKNIVADWTGKETDGKPCGNYNTETKKCSGQNF